MIFVAKSRKSFYFCLTKSRSKIWSKNTSNILTLYPRTQMLREKLYDFVARVTAPFCAFQERLKRNTSWKWNKKCCAQALHASWNVSVFYCLWIKKSGYEPNPDSNPWGYFSCCSAIFLVFCFDGFGDPTIQRYTKTSDNGDRFISSFIVNCVNQWTITHNERRQS